MPHAVNLLDRGKRKSENKNIHMQFRMLRFQAKRYKKGNQVKMME
jgi:hypothetical protein